MYEMHRRKLPAYRLAAKRIERTALKKLEREIAQARADYAAGRYYTTEQVLQMINARRD